MSADQLKHSAGEECDAARRVLGVVHAAPAARAAAVAGAAARLAGRGPHLHPHLSQARSFDPITHIPNFKTIRKQLLAWLAGCWAKGRTPPPFFTGALCQPLK